MRLRLPSLILFCAPGIILFLTGPVAATAQSVAAKAVSKDIPRLSNGKPDLNGVWDRPRVSDVTKDGAECGSGTQGCKQVGAKELPFTAWGLAQNNDKKRYDYTARCMPWGLTRAMQTEYPLEIMQTPDRMAYLFESNNIFHVVPIDGRSHMKDADPSWNGNSVGHYEGDTLVIDTVGFNEKTYLDTVWHPHSDQMHLIERITPIDANHLNYELTVDDPKAYSKPWKNSRTFVRMKPGSEIMEWFCDENNRDAAHIVDGQ